jgi:hypothetical protein
MHHIICLNMQLILVLTCLAVPILFIDLHYISNCHDHRDNVNNQRACGENSTIRALSNGYTRCLQPVDGGEFSRCPTVAAALDPGACRSARAAATGSLGMITFRSVSLRDGGRAGGPRTGNLGITGTAGTVGAAWRKTVVCRLVS